MTLIYRSRLGAVPPLAGFRDEHARIVDPARSRAAKAMKLERALSDLVNLAHGLTLAEIELMWQTAPPRMSIPSPFPSS
jgi:hypothetical protein